MSVREPPDTTIGDPKQLAGLLIELARSLNRDLAEQVPSPLDADVRLEEVRRIITGPERAQLARLEQRLGNHEALADSVSRVLPAAIAQAATRDERLGQVLSPTVERATQTSIRKDPRTLINILYPVMVPAIRKSIGEALEGTLQSLNDRLKHSLSWRGLKWRVEALRTGTSFAEVVLKHTVAYRVEHVLLIHKQTGLLLDHVAADVLAAKDPQLVSGMLTAIQDFVRDSFTGTAEGGLDALRLGDLLVWCEDGPRAMLVALIRGNPPQMLHERLRQTLATIHEEKRSALENFDGDTAAFLDIRPLLESCLLVQEKPQERSVKTAVWAIAAAALVMLAVAGAWMYQRYRDDARFTDYVQRLRSEPGIVVTRAERGDGAWQIAGLRDPLAADPDKLRALAGLAPGSVVETWEPYQTLQPSFVLRRMEASLDPPPTVALSVEQGRVRASGSASRTWVEKARSMSNLLPLGVPPLDVSEVRDLDKSDIERLREQLAQHVIRFDQGAPYPAAGQEATLDLAAAQLRELESVARRLRLDVRAMVIGHADKTGRDTTNLALSIGRAEVVRSLLRGRGVDPALLSVRGAGPLEPLQAEISDSDRSANRRVSFAVIVND